MAAAGTPPTGIAGLTRPPVVVERQGRVAWVTLDRPEAMNALSQALVHGLREAIAALRADPHPPVVVLTGAGQRAFCAGADLKERLAMTHDDARAFVVTLGQLMEEISYYPQPVIAAIAGVALGGGFELALACDLRLAEEGVELGLPEVRLGIIPGAGGTQRLARLCGIAVAKDLVLTGRRIDAARAWQLGLISAVVPRAELRGEAERWAAMIADAGPLAVAQAKRAIDDGWGKSLEGALAVERAGYDVVLRSEDRDEGLRAFADKRKPSFTGK